MLWLVAIIVVIILVLLMVGLFLCTTLDDCQYVKSRPRPKPYVRHRTDKSDKICKGLKIAVVTTPDHPVTITNSVHHYKVFTVTSVEDAIKVYQNDLKRGYDLIVGGQNSAEVELWASTQPTTPLVAVNSGAYLEVIKNSTRLQKLLYRITPNDNRTLPLIVRRFGEIDEIPLSEVYNDTGLIVTQGLTYSDSLVDIFVSNAVKEDGVDPQQFKQTHVRYVSSSSDVRQALQDFKDFKYNLYAASGFFNDLNTYGQSTLVSGGSNIIVLSQGFNAQKLPTAYVDGDAKFNVVATSYALDPYQPTSEGALTDLYVPPVNEITLAYSQTLNKLERARSISDVARVLGLSQLSGEGDQRSLKTAGTSLKADQGYQPVYARILISSYRSNLFNIPDIEGYGVVGYTDMGPDEESSELGTVFRLGLVPVKSIIVDEADADEGGVRYTGPNGQRLNIRYDQVDEYPDAVVPLYGSVLSVDYEPGAVGDPPCEHFWCLI